MGLEEKLVFEREISASEKMKKENEKAGEKVQEKSTREKYKREETKRRK